MNTLSEIDQQLAQRYGSYASYPTTCDPTWIETYGDGPADEMDRLLDNFAQPGKYVLDLGCGAGFTLCRLAPQVEAIWGFDEDADLLAAARQRIGSLGLTNATLIQGNVAAPTDVAQLPGQTFDVIFSRRGPNVNTTLMEKLKPEAYVIQELYQDCPSLLEMFGRKSFMRDVGDNPHWLIEQYAWLELFPVSIKAYYYESFFRDADHLIAYLMQPTMFFSWPLPPLPYEESRDRAALDLYVRYNTTPKGIRLVNHRKVYLFRRTAVQYMPVAPTLKPHN